MGEMKRCQQCGLLKEAESYRPYTYAKQKGTQGRYRICRQCEAINTQYKRAKQTVAAGCMRTADGTTIPEAYDASMELIAKIDKLYAALELRGLRVPCSKPVNQEPTNAAVDMLLEFYREDSRPTTTVEHTKDSIPADLAHWLDTSWDEWLDGGLSPEYLQETVYESLKAKYRPQTGIDKERLLPVYDDTYKSVLNDILKRFDDFEEYVAAQDGE